MSIPSDLAIAQAAPLRPIAALASDLGLGPDDYDFYGKYKAKVFLEVLDRLHDRPLGKYIDVTAITPTPLGEGKTTTTVGLTQALGRLGKRAIACIRQPSQGPTFGIKGGAAGGGYSQIIPMEDFNLHLTGDIHAITAAHNLIAAALEARWYHESRLEDDKWAKLGLPRLNIDPDRIQWRRVLDVNDRALRNITVGQGGEDDGLPRQTGFDISVASELMAILALTTGLADMRARIGRMILAQDTQGRPITAEQLGVAGAAAVLLREAIRPNLLQTLEGQAAFVHAGPFANIAHGNSSILADQIALRLGEYVITESGFGADIGMEKFFHIKCRASGLIPQAIVLVATIRALKMHGGGPKVVPGKALAADYLNENLPLLEAGMANLVAHINIARQFGIPVVVAVNRFGTDSPAEIRLAQDLAVQAGAYAAVPADHFAEGGAGAIELAEAVMSAAEQPSQFSYLYEPGDSLKSKIETIARRVYGAEGVSYSPEAEAQLADFTAQGLGHLPICMAKTHLSLSHDPALKGAPSGFTLPIREVRAAAGAGFIYPLVGDIRTMPGLGTKPAYLGVDLDEGGRVRGLF
jgi:methylenetetrahydrofolate dehydrogenase (NADP+)/methenyltetrahydrofolate cyclohydrolase/formyltetrahydrofolate synthetase/formate--tetrahydrofolate ligase